MSVQEANLVIIDFERLLQPYDDDLDQLIEKAYGVNGLGVLAVRNVPDYLPLRNALLPMAYQFASLPDDIKNKYVHEESLYSFGWSHGKERLVGKPDLAKGSYYANPVYNQPSDDKELIQKYISTLHPNIWPSDDDFPGLENAFMSLGKKICDVGAFIAQCCDAYVSKRNPLFPTNKLTKSIVDSKCGKARLLYYFPYEKPTDHEVTEDELSNWCGIHADSGSLTGLTSAIFFDSKTGQQVPNPDPKAGLYIKSRQNEEYHVKIPADCVAFQIGECFQIHSSGLLRATPHAVRACEVEGISRSTFACFMQPQYDMKMELPPGADKEMLVKGTEYYPPGVPTLLSRWDIEGTQTYGEFATATFAKYY